MRSGQPTRRLDGLYVENDDHRSLKRIAARLLATKDFEEQALADLDKIARGIERKIRLRFILATIGFISFMLFALVAVAAWMTASVDRPAIGDGLLALAIAFATAACASLLSWRYLQYPFGPFGKTRLPIYPVGSTAEIEALEKLFTHLSLRTSPKLYYRIKNGEKRDVSRAYLKSRLRGLLIADDAADRALALPPGKPWFWHEIKVDAEPEEIIAALKARPRSGGRPKQIDYEAILLELIEQDRLKAIDPDARGSESQLMALIHALCDASDEHDTDIRVPEPTELRAFAKKVLAAVRKSRARQK
jgi:hypothetical protein